GGNREGSAQSGSAGADAGIAGDGSHHLPAELRRSATPPGTCPLMVAPVRCPIDAAPADAEGKVSCKIRPSRESSVPKRLPARWRAECIRRFRAAAQQRFDDGLACAAAGRRTGAIYLWGYSAEMTLKAACFTLTGIAETTYLTLAGHINPAINRGRNVLGIVW